MRCARRGHGGQRRRFALARAARRGLRRDRRRLPTDQLPIGKLYTKTFYELIDRHLGERLRGGADDLALIARKSFLTVATTIEAAGLGATPYHAHVPSFGEWASSSPAGAVRLPTTPPAGLRFLDLQGCRRCSNSA
jgi:predicted membrane-bound spermidine synthase